MGRKPIGKNPMTPAERKRKHRENLERLGKKTITIELPVYVIDIVDDFRSICGGDMSRSETIESVMETWAIDSMEAMPKLKALFAEREARKRAV